MERGFYEATDKPGGLLGNGPVMLKAKHPRIRRKIVVIVSLGALILMGAGVGMGVWSAKKMRDLVVDQFNGEQLVIAEHVSTLIEREINFLRRELLLLRKEKISAVLDRETLCGAMENAFSRVLEHGVWKIEILDLKARRIFTLVPYGQCMVRETPEKGPNEIPSRGVLDNQEVWVSQPLSRPNWISLIMATSLPGDFSGALVFHVNVSWLLTPYLRDIRSGKTGYAWLIDGDGLFLSHPNADFVGQSALEIREEKFPGIPFGIINFIQKKKMLEGEVGTGWYYSGWHRGITGKIKKLIAYCPVEVSSDPPQKWSVAVVAPISEIEDALRAGHRHQLMFQGLVILVILLGAGAILFFETRWSRILEVRVEKRTEELKKSEDKYRSLVESAEDFIFAVDSGGRFQSMNSFTANYFGGSPEEFLGKGLDSLFPPGIVEKQLKLVSLVYEFGKSVRDEFEMEIGEHEIWISANFMPLKNEEGVVNAVLCIARDITESKILERQLINAEKLASMGTLAAGVAHEINNPLGVILGFCDLLLRKTDKVSQEYEDLKTIERQGLHCKDVVENLLSFARHGEGESEYCDLNACLEEIIKVVKHTLEMQDLELETMLAENIPWVKGDSRQLQQVFLNLINNAISAMEKGGSLKIRTYLERSTRKAVVEFQDRGIGISPEDMDHIFEPFFTTKPEGEGTGLGLFVSYGIVKKYGGTMDCASHRSSSLKPGGSTFTVKLLTKRREV
jgi:two-component system NtrC family sensor kinase